MVDSVTSDLREYSMQFFDAGLCEEMQRHLGSLHIESEVSTPGSPGCLHTTNLLRSGNILLLGCLKVKDRAFDFLDVYVMSAGSNRGGASKAYGYGYVLDRVADDKIDDFSVKLKVIRKGFIERKVIGFAWKGGRLADRLNSDSSLMNLLGMLDPGSPSLGASLGYSGWGSTWQVMASRYDDFISVWQPVRDPHVFPSRTEMDIAEKLAGHLKDFLRDRI